MAHSSDAAKWLRDGGLVARRLEGFEERPQQQQMAAAVAHALDSRRPLFVEAGTGVGKTLAYLAPAIERIIQNREVVVVSTNTIALQEQLIQKDVPLLAEAFSGQFRAALVKGRGNYVSLRRLQLASERQESLYPDEESMSELHAIEDWATTTRDGSLASLSTHPSTRIWESVQSDASNCLGRRCPNFETCFYQSARREMEQAQLLICNHALFFADLALRQKDKGFLPAYDHVILDEAHAIEDVACEAFGVQVSESRIGTFLRALWTARSRKGLLASVRVDGAGQEVGDAVTLVAEAASASAKLFSDLSSAAQSGGTGRLRERLNLANPLTPALVSLAAALRRCKEKCTREADALEMNSQADRAGDLALAVDTFLNQSVEGCVYWVESSRARERSHHRRAGRQQGGAASHGADRPHVTMRGCVVDVAPILRNALYGTNRGVVLCSATLALGSGDFTHAAKRLGCDEPTTLQLDSPFNYRAQCRLIVDLSLAPRPSRDPRTPRGRADERDPPDLHDRIAERVLHHVRATDGGAFVLFTSYSMLRDVAACCESAFAEDQRTFLVHGRDVGRSALLDRFREDRRSVLFGTATFWQGVDVRGEALRNVIIAKLPFDVPDRPLVQARSEAVEATGGRAFWDDSLPRAILRLKQGFGRLIRSTTDRGQVVILDPRIYTKRYGRAFLAALPKDMEVEEVGGEGGDGDGEGEGGGGDGGARGGEYNAGEVDRVIEFE